MARGGPAVYARNLVAGLRSVGLPDGPDLRVVTPGALLAWGSPWGRLAVARAARRWGADLVHGLHVEAPPVGVPTVVTIHDVIPLDHPPSVPNPALRLAYRRLLATALRRASQVIVPSPASEARVLALGVDPPRVTVVPLGIGPQFRPLDDGEREHARRRFAGGRRYVVASAGPRAHKNLAGLVAAAARLAPDVAVVATGTGRRVDAPRLSFAGRLGDDEIARLYGGAEAMVLPAVVEGFGLPAVEASACGVPVVCGPGTGALAYVGRGAVEVDVRSAADLAAAVRGLLDDDHLRTTLGAAGREQAAPLTLETMARATLGVYRRVLASAGISRR